MEVKLAEIRVRLIDIRSDVKKAIEQFFRYYAEAEDLDKLGRLARAYYEFEETLEKLIEASKNLAEVIE